MALRAILALGRAPWGGSEGSAIRRRTCAGRNFAPVWALMRSASAAWAGVSWMAWDFFMGFS